MATASQAYDALRARIEAGGLTFPLVWQNEDYIPPDVPATFAYFELIIEAGGIVAFGGGPGSNVHRNVGRLDAYVFVPRGMGLKTATNAAELIAAIVRSYRDATISCFAATVMPGGDGADLQPPGMSSPVDGYFWSRMTADILFDQLG